MESNPKRWMMRNLSPRLGVTEQTTQDQLESSLENGCGMQSDANSYSWEHILVNWSQPSVTVTPGQEERMGEVVVHARQVSVVEEKDDWNSESPESPGSPQTGFYSFEDTTQEAEKTEAWMSSPQREAKLATLRVENGFKLRAYHEEQKPDKLFAEENGDARYRITDGDGPLEDQELEYERLQIIRSQAPKKSSTFNEQWNTLQIQDTTKSPSRLMEGFALHYNTPSEQSSHMVESESIDTKQIDFSAARQQFLMMERSNQNPFLQSPQQLQTPKLQAFPHMEERTTFAVKVNQGDEMEEKPALPQKQYFEKDTPVDEVFTSKRVTVSLVADSSNGSKRQNICFDDLDSGLGELSLDLGGGYASDSSTSHEVLVSKTPTKTETPIEREIRIAQEREENLRRERGILRSDSKEIVQIKTKPFLSQDCQTSSPTVGKTKEKARVSFFIQREIEREIRREEDLLHEGKVAGLYDRGTPQELEERKRVFELKPDEVPVMPIRMSLSGKLVDATKSKSGTEDGRLTPEVALIIEDKDNVDTEGFIPPCCPHRHPDENDYVLKAREKDSPVKPQKERLGSEENKYRVQHEIKHSLLSRGDQLPNPEAGVGDKDVGLKTSAVSKMHTTAEKSPDISVTKVLAPLVVGDDQAQLITVKDSVQFTLPRDHLGPSSVKESLCITMPNNPLSSTPVRDSFGRMSLEHSVNDSLRYPLVQGLTGIPTATDIQDFSEVHDPKRPWHSQHEKFQMKTRKLQTPEAIRLEIEEDLKRELELRRLREGTGLSSSRDGDLNGLDRTSPVIVSPTAEQSKESSPLLLQYRKLTASDQVAPEPGPAPAVERYKGATLPHLWGLDAVDHAKPKVTPLKLDNPETTTPPLASPRFAPRAPLLSMVTAQPWGSPRPQAPSSPREPPVMDPNGRCEPSTLKGLTETLLENFEERRIKQRLEENAYAGIQPSDDVNNEVLEATRVTRHKNTRALLWEAGMYTNTAAD
ncbi:mitotic interactor and substrate of PLK1 isoform X2 [Lepisosteus oculatus]|uniref:mitotic interactor and substrate of PLK1 isoform X2 n=1 Tax=Lepisosteus oculatus TaxID=7918 RepID=UPI00073FCBF2|nr:PREDICTED: mitotic interactor and substrate of PLK1 [Lepisosteus oculatus]XP_015221281.1 PREDICTED: mitotic interactor and substrate of PLK1 [Lepisosteus oculatus]XP_015221282.1 PREDICTED: mitotic interactor and substrate of PLK1 [Lepisosteus oculatus]